MSNSVIITLIICGTILIIYITASIQSYLENIEYHRNKKKK